MNVWTSHASTTEEAKQEAQTCIRQLKEWGAHNFPVCFAWTPKEAEEIKPELAAKIHLVFMRMVQAAGHPANYTSDIPSGRLLREYNKIALVDDEEAPQEAEKDTGKETPTKSRKPRKKANKAAKIDV